MLKILRAWIARLLFSPWDSLVENERPGYPPSSKKPARQLMSTTFGIKETTIVKVQLPITSNGTNPLPLVYDKHMAHQIQQPIERKTYDALKGDVKGYFQATFNGEVWIVGKRVPGQLW